jgi:hypothetical protein
MSLRRFRSGASDERSRLLRSTTRSPYTFKSPHSRQTRNPPLGVGTADLPRQQGQGCNSRPASQLSRSISLTTDPCWSQTTGTSMGHTAHPSHSEGPLSGPGDSSAVVHGACVSVERPTKAHPRESSGGCERDRMAQGSAHAPVVMSIPRAVGSAASPASAPEAPSTLRAAARGTPTAPAARRIAESAGH